MAKEGKDTSEYAVTKETSLVAWIGTALGVLVVAVPQISQNFDVGSIGSTICGVVLVIASQATKLLNSLGFQKSRSNVKVAEALRENPTATVITSNGTD